jgi:NAD(P)-dependent dehydrogenase (short-subunit alcohol dehydrogenase family)
MFTFELAEQLKMDGIMVNCLHPGSLLDTKMVREFTDTPLGSAESGAAAVIHVASDPDLDHRTGVYFYEKREARAHEQAYDRDARKKLWRITAKLTGIG